MEYLIIGLATLFNIVVIKIKFEKGRLADAALDSIVLFGVMSLFSGSYGALVVGVIASAGFSIYLMFSPPKFTEQVDIEDLKKRLSRNRRKRRSI